jgi:hypothetical protein
MTCHKELIAAGNSIMKIARVFLALAVAVFFISGCIVQSLNPYYTKESVTTVPGITGEWRLLDEKGNPAPGRPWVFQKDKVLTYEKKTAEGTLRTTYFRIGEALFLDTLADDPGDGTNKWWTMHVFPVHLVSKVEIHDNRMALIPIDYDWIDRALKNRDVKLPHTRLKEGDSVIFTASPEEWTEFLKKYSSDRNVFQEKNAVRFIK